MIVRIAKGNKPGTVPARAVDLDEIIDFLFDLFDLLDLIIDVLRNLGNYLSGR